MIRPGVPAPNLRPRMGEDALRERGGVQYRELRSRSLLNRCDSPRMPFQWTVNPYRGCAFGCSYCYAKFMGITEPEQFHRLVYVKVGAEEETARRLAGIVRRGQSIALGTATDPYQPGESEAKVTRRFLQLVAQHRGVRLGITTKGALILRDLDLLERIHQRSRVSVHFSLTSLDPELMRRLEPWAPPPDVRLEAMRRLGEVGIEVALNAMPILPGLTDAEPGLDALFARAAAAGVRRATARLLFLRSTFAGWRRSSPVTWRPTSTPSPTAPTWGGVMPSGCTTWPSGCSRNTGSSRASTSSRRMTARRPSSRSGVDPHGPWLPAGRGIL
jgi:DNA repair photolyase